MQDTEQPFATGTARKYHDHARPALADDLERAQVIDRRRALGLFGMASTGVMLAACGADNALSTSTGSSSSGSSGSTPTPTSTSSSADGSTTCTSYASETNGPYPADGTNTSSGAYSNVVTVAAFQRADIRPSINGGNTAAGTQMDFTITLVDVNNNCAPLANYLIYIWHCDAVGRYSLYDLPAENFLRGLQTTDANGQVTFTTIVPGTYNGRFPHIHFEVYSSITNASNGRSARLISQFSLPKDVLASLYAANPTYTGSISALNNTSLASDNVFGDNSAAQQTAMMMSMSGSASAGYTASATVGLAT